MKGEIPLNDADEYDAIEGRKFYRFRAGTRRKTKKKYNKRVRQHIKAMIRNEEA